jgi:hypothetical protein
VIADAEDEPNLNKAYLAELLENPGEYVEYCEDSLCCSADAKILYEDYDPVQDEVALPFTLDPSDEMSVESSSSKYENAYAYEDYDLNPYEDNHYASYNVNVKKTTTDHNMMFYISNPMKQTTSHVEQPTPRPNKTFCSGNRYPKTTPGKTFGDIKTSTRSNEVIVDERDTYNDVYTPSPILMMKPQVRKFGNPREDTVPRSSLQKQDSWNEDDRSFLSKPGVNNQYYSSGHHYPNDSPFSTKPQDARRVQKLWPDNVHQKTYGRPPPQYKTTTSTGVSDCYGTSDNMTNYWSTSSVKTNRSGVLSSQRDDPPFLAQSQPTYRPLPGTTAALRSRPTPTVSTDEPVVPNLEPMEIPSEDSQVEQNDHPPLTITEDSNQEKPK